jgi:hypothetical protein
MKTINYKPKLVNMVNTVTKGRKANLETNCAGSLTIIQ